MKLKTLKVKRAQSVKLNLKCLEHSTHFVANDIVNVNELTN